MTNDSAIIDGMTAEEQNQPTKRKIVGLAQKNYQPARKVEKLLQHEITVWFLLIILTGLNLFIFNYLASKAPNANSFLDLSAITAGLTLLIVEFFILPIIVRIVFNFIVLAFSTLATKRTLFPLTSIVQIFNIVSTGTILTAATLIIAAFSSVIQENVLAPLQELSSGPSSYTPVPASDLHPIEEFSKLDTGVQLLAILILLDVLVFLVLTLLAIITIFRICITSIIALVESFRLLPLHTYVSDQIKIVNFHPFDAENVKLIFFSSSHNVKAVRNDKDFEIFLKKNDFRNIRVLLLNKKPAGIYVVDNSRTILEEVMVSPEYRDNGLGKIMINDFLKKALSYHKKRIVRARFFNEDSGTEQMLTKNGWIFSQNISDREIEYAKTITKENHQQ